MSKLNLRKIFGSIETRHQVEFALSPHKTRCWWAELPWWQNSTKPRKQFKPENLLLHVLPSSDRPLLTRSDSCNNARAMSELSSPGSRVSVPALNAPVVGVDRRFAAGRC